MKKLLSVLLLATVILPAFARPCFADWDHDHRLHHGPWRSGIHRVYDPEYWHHGHWWHGVHGGRPGWWWVLNGSWFFYPRPVYPYPAPYAPPVVLATPPGSYGYYCASPAGYYPQVQQCYGPWSPVP